MNAISITPQLENMRIVDRVGGKSIRDISHAAKRRIQTVKDRFTDLVKSDIHYKTYPIRSIDGESIRLSTGQQFCSQKLATTLEPCRELIAFVATIGGKLEKEIATLTDRNRSSMAYIMDAIGSVAVESTVEQFQKLQARAYKKTSQYVTLRFSPGYCDWSIEEQKKLFSLFDSDEISVELSDSCLMHPRKSISGVFGVTPPMRSSFHRYNPCKACNKTGCDGRRERFRSILAAK